MRHPTLMNDIIFKIVFGSPQNVPVLRALLNAILQLSGQERIQSLELLNPYVDKEYLRERGAILDVKCRDGLGRLYNVEVQVSDEPHYVARSLYYLARLFGEQLQKGDPYSRIARTIGISILDFSLFPDHQDVHSTFRFYDSGHALELSELLEIHYLELVKFRQDKPGALRTPLEKWLHVLKFGDLYQSGLEALPAPLQTEEGIVTAMEAMRRAYASAEVREMIEFRLKALHDEATRLERARLEGESEGEARGEAKGEAKARADVARKMLASGMDAATVRDLTGLDPGSLHES